MNESTHNSLDIYFDSILFSERKVIILPPPYYLNLKIKAPAKNSRKNSIMTVNKCNMTQTQDLNRDFNIISVNFSFLLVKVSI